MKITTGQRIAGIRRAAGMRQADAARRAGMSQSQWSDIERDRKSPTIRTLQRVADALGCTLADLV